VNAPCNTCPWRKSSTVGGADIPNFKIDLMRNLCNTVGPGDDFRPIMACHGSACGAERPCVGYVAVEGMTNFNVRMVALADRIDIASITEACPSIDLWPSSVLSHRKPTTCGDTGKARASAKSTTTQRGNHKALGQTLSEAGTTATTAIRPRTA